MCVCNTFYNSAVDKLKEMIVSNPFYLIQSLKGNIGLKVWAMPDISGSRSREILNAFD